jgi:hypothetical protein
MKIRSHSESFIVGPDDGSRWRITADADVPIDIRVEGRLAGGHQNRIFAFDMRRQAGARHSCQA